MAKYIFNPLVINELHIITFYNINGVRMDIGFEQVSELN